MQVRNPLPQQSTQRHKEKMGVVVAVVLQAVSASQMREQAAGEPGWRVGWGFESHGGFPANPWHSWAMNKSTAVYVRALFADRTGDADFI